MITPTKPRRGFTLIELLVVIAILAVLAAILLPVFAQAREKARQASCMSNVKNIGMAVMMYTQDHDETLPDFGFRICPPQVVYPGQGPTYALLFTEFLQPYLKNKQVFFCPSASIGEQDRLTDWGAYYGQVTWLADYALLTWGPGGDGT